MRSRPDVNLKVSSRTIEPGQTLSVEAQLVSHTETPFDWVRLELVGTERSAHGKKRHVHTVCHLMTELPGGVLQPGEHLFRCDFELPWFAPPSYRSATASIEYAVTAHVSIPWWPDRHESWSINVRAALPELPSEGPQLFTSEAGTYRGEDPVLELSLPDWPVRPGQLLGGVAAITGLGNRAIRYVEVSIVAIEKVTLGSWLPTTRHIVRETIHTGQPVDGKPMPFEFRVPRSIPRPFATMGMRLDLALQLEANVAFGRDLGITVPLKIGASPTENETPESRDLLVGRERQRRIWEAAAERTRASGNPSAEVRPDGQGISLSHAGIGIKVFEEQRPHEGPCLSATLDSPFTGLDMRIAERTWTTFGEMPPGVHLDFARRFSLRVREPAQIASRLDKELVTALVDFSEVGMDDREIVVLRVGGAYVLDGLLQFLELVCHLASLLADRARHIRPPSELSRSRDAYQRFADAHSARLRVADLSIHDWMVRGIALSITHRFDGPRPVNTVLSTPFPGDAIAEEAIDEFRRATGANLVIEAGTATVTMPVVHDPAKVALLGEAFGDCIATLRGVASGGPYR